MKSIRKYISLILLIFVFCTVVDVNNLPYLHAEEVVVNLYDLNNSVETFDLDLESTYAILFNAGIPIKEVQLYIDNAPVNRSKLEMDLYSFDTSYGNTIRKEAIVSKTFERFGRDTWLSFEIGNINAGEYLLVITPKQGNIKVKVSEGKLDTVRMYENTSSLNMNFFCRLVLEKGDGNSLEKVSDFKNKFIALPDTWACTDGLNRTLPLQKDVGKKREDKYVGVFFHTWHSRFSAHSFADISQILKQNPNEKNSSNINWGDKFSYFWSEPIWGYYDTRDKWVLRKQAEMLADAGVDVIIMDNTNGTDIFKEGLLSLLQVFSEARADGVKTPQVSFMLPMFGPYEDTAN